jgi:outer membrane lipoprotein-sorting protein
MKMHFKLILFLLTVLIFPTFCQASATILSNTNPDHTVISGSDEQVYGTSASNQIILESGAKADLINFPGHSSIQIQSSSELFIISRSETVVAFQGSDDGTILKPHQQMIA